MADIAFLLLIFFLVATNLVQDKGLMTQLPPDAPPTPTQIKERNVFNILINSSNQFLVEGEIRENINGLSDELKSFILNPGQHPDYAESPKEAIISIKSQRGTKYANFIAALDESKEAYYQIYGEKVGLTSEEFRKLNLSALGDKAVYDKARTGLPMAISIANPD